MAAVAAIGIVIVIVAIIFAAAIVVAAAIVLVCACSHYLVVLVWLSWVLIWLSFTLVWACLHSSMLVYASCCLCIKYKVSLYKMNILTYIL